ncbi:MAG: PHP domain-containing protein [Planctomycetota bacterium]
MSDQEALTEELNAPTKAARLAALSALMEKVGAGEITFPATGCDVNNHIHTTYSFSPYSPTKSVWMARMAGLSSAGIMDHDSIAGAEEFIEAGRIAELPITIGVECRVDCSKTQLNGRRINNPDQDSVAYMTIHGIPHQKISEVKAFFEPRIAARHVRNRAMVEKLNALMPKAELQMDYDSDILSLSQAEDGGTVTERHILFALARKLLALYPDPAELIACLEELKVPVSEKLREQLADTASAIRDYDLLGGLKSGLVKHFYIPATDECPDIRETVDFARAIGAIPAYAYLGDVGNSVTGDKAAQAFEDSYLDLLIDEIREIGFRAVTYMPSRNTPEQADRIMALCKAAGFFQVSGEDINQPRQNFVCLAQRDAKFAHLVDATWALIGHEGAATDDPAQAFFSDATVAQYPDLEERIRVYGKKANK